jgi:hypothetical protein
MWEFGSASLRSTSKPGTSAADLVDPGVAGVLDTFAARLVT